MERVKKLECSTEESLGIEETVCMKSVVRNWRDPTHHRKVKRKHISYQYPSRKAMKKMKAEIKRNVNNRSLLVAKEEDLIKNLNPKITGWKNYYSTKTNEKWMQALDWYIICSFARWYNKKHRRRHHMSKVGFVRNSIYEKGLKKMAKA